MKAISDWIFLGIIGLLMTNTFIQSELFDYVISLNNYLGFIACAVVFIMMLKSSLWKRCSLGWLLILGTFNILNFGLGKVSFAVSIGKIEAPSVNPLIFLILIVYLIVNKTSIKRIIKNTLYGTENDREKKYQKMVDFYIKKFESSSEAELGKILKDFDDYPLEAQVALNQIQKKRLQANYLDQ